MLSLRFFLPTLAASGVFAASINRRADYTTVCEEISQAVGSASKVAFPGSAHAQPSACTVEPATAEDVGKVLKIVGPSRTPFAIKSGGHSYNPNFSSTSGVLIVMTQFHGTVYNAATDTATFGAGQPWSTVYTALLPFNRTVVGGRAPGVGVGGLATGGGFAWHSSQYGLPVDHIVAYELVTPAGDVTQVTENSNAELFWALKGSSDNFGIVTKFTFQTIEHTQVWGGVIDIGPEHIDAVVQAFANYDVNGQADKKAALNAALGKVPGVDGISTTFQVFYNAPTPPPGIFDEILAIPAANTNIKTRTLPDLVGALHFGDFKRSFVDHIPTNRFPLDLVKAYVKELDDVATSLEGTFATVVSIVLEGFSRDLLKQGGKNVQGFDTPSAWPGHRRFATFPNAIWIAHNDAKDDQLIADTGRKTSEHMRDVGAALGVTETANAPDVPKYPNYSLYQTTNEQLYGSVLPKLQELKKKYDPTNVFELTGGFKL